MKLNDNIENVTTLIKDVQKIMKLATLECKKLWKQFIKDCRKFIRYERKRIALKWESLRFAIECAENAHVLATQSTNYVDRDMTIKSILLQNDSNLFGYLEYVKKYHHENRTFENNNQYVGDLYKSCFSNDVTLVARVARKWMKYNILDHKLSINIDKYSMGSSIRIYYDSMVEGAKESANKLKLFINRFNYDKSDYYSEYHNVNFYCNIVKL